MTSFFPTFTDLRFSSEGRPSPGARPVMGAEIDSALRASPVLIIEDEAMIAWMLESLLEDMGFEEIVIASSGEDAIRKARQMTPCLILSDINLAASELDGIEASAAIVARTKAPVVFITAHAGVDARERIERDVPGSVVLRKPVNGADLKQAIADVVNRNSKGSC